MNKENILTQEQKDMIIDLHWNSGSLEEHMYYRQLMEHNEDLKAIYEESWKEVVEKYNPTIPTTYEEFISCMEHIDFDLCEEYDEFELNLMATLDEKLNVGVYEDEEDIPLF